MSTAVHVSAALFLAAFAGLFAARAGDAVTSFALLLVTGMPLAGETSFARGTLLAALAGALSELVGPRRGPSLVPFVFVAAVAHLVLENVLFAIAPPGGGPDRRTAAVNWGAVLVTYAWLVSDRARYRAAVPWSPVTGVYTAAVHLAWALLTFGTLDVPFGADQRTCDARAPLSPMSPSWPSSPMSPNWPSSPADAREACDAAVTAAWTSAVAVHIAMGATWRWFFA